MGKFVIPNFRANSMTHSLHADGIKLTETQIHSVFDVNVPNPNRSFHADRRVVRTHVYDSNMKSLAI